MNQFDKMLQRALMKTIGLSRLDNADNSIGVRVARSIMGSQKGRPSLMKGFKKPGLMEIVEEFNAWSCPSPALAGFSKILSPKDFALLDKSLMDSFDWSKTQSCWSVFSKMEFPSLHDAYVAKWERRGDVLEILVDGYFSNGGPENMNVVSIEFENPRIEAIWDGRRVKVAGEGLWERGVENKLPFLSSACPAPKGAGKGKLVQRRYLAFDDLPWIQTEEFGSVDEPEPALRVSLGVRQVELSIEAPRVKVLWGQRAIDAERSRRELLSTVPEARADGTALRI